MGSTHKLFFSTSSLVWLCFKPKSSSHWIAFSALWHTSTSSTWNIDLPSLFGQLSLQKEANSHILQGAFMTLTPVLAVSPYAVISLTSTVVLITLEPHFLHNCPLSLSFSKCFERRKGSLEPSHSLAHCKKSVNSGWMNDKEYLMSDQKCSQRIKNSPLFRWKLNSIQFLHVPCDFLLHGSMPLTSLPHHCSTTILPKQKRMQI